MELPRGRNNLERLRQLRGNDEAVVEVGSGIDQSRLVSVLMQPALHTRNDLLTAVSASFSGEAYGDVHWSKYTGGWTTPKEPTPYGNFRSMYPALAQLSFYPGFMTHLPAFMDAAGKGEVPTGNAHEARDAFKTRLGNRTMWRGTMLTEEELEAIRTGGSFSSLADFVPQSDEPLEQFEAKLLSTYPDYLIEAHFHGENRFSPFLSISAHPDVAIAVGKHFGKRDPNRKFYLFKLNLPEIDVISYTEHAFRMPSKLKSSLDFNPDFGINITIDNQSGRYKWNADVESYLFWKIDPNEIVEITQPTIKESSWNGRKISWVQ